MPITTCLLLLSSFADDGGFSRRGCDSEVAGEGAEARTEMAFQRQRAEARLHPHRGRVAHPRLGSG